MTIKLPDLPFERDALAPNMSAETLDYHHGKHHRKYVDTTNEMIKDSEYAGMDLDEIVRTASGKLFNNAAQVWNHNFFWNCLSPEKSEPSAALGEALSKAFGSVENFKDQFATAAAGQFGSGWAWLVREKGGELGIVTTDNAGNPLTDGHTPLLTCDVWEHAYYIDYRNQRPEYLKKFWAITNWSFVSGNWEQAN